MNHDDGEGSLFKRFHRCASLCRDIIWRSIAAARNSRMRTSTRLAFSLEDRPVSFSDRAMVPRCGKIERTTAIDLAVHFSTCALPPRDFSSSWEICLDPLLLRRTDQRDEGKEGV